MDSQHAAKWLRLLGAAEAPHEYALALQPGDCVPAAPPYPDLRVTAVDTAYVRRVVMQTITATATAADEGAEAVEVVVARLVAELEGGGEIEIQRLVGPAQAGAADEVDLTRCAACGRSIIAGEALVVGVRAYHPACVSA